MGRKAAKAETTKAPSNEPAKEAAVTAPVKEEKAKTSKAAKKKEVEEGSAPSVLQSLRPKPRVIFFITFLLLCTGIVTWSEPCGVKEGQRKDCGYPGISVTECRSVSCFLRGKSGTFKKTVKVKREEGSTLGLVLNAGETRTVKEVLAEGAVEKYNAKLSNTSEDIIRPGDQVIKIDGSAGKSMMDALTKTKSRTVELEIQRLRIPSFLSFVQNTKGKPNVVERMLTSSGSYYFAQTWRHLATLAVPCWYCSGYPVASLPVYLTITSAVSWHLSRCCHDTSVKSGVAHCYRSKKESLQQVLERVWSNVKEASGKVAKDPKGYFTWAFVPQK